MVEAKGEIGWTNKQLDSKASRLAEIFGTGTIEDDAPIRPVFCLWSPVQSFGLIPDAWPAWMVRPSAKRSVHDIAWMRLDVPARRKKVTGVDKAGRNSIKRPFWTLERVRPEEIAE